MNMNTNMNMNGRKKRETLEEISKRKLLSEFSNSTLGSAFNEDMLNDLYESFSQCKTHFDSMSGQCQEDIIMVSWQNMRKLFGDQECNSELPDQKWGPPTNSHSSLANRYIRFVIFEQNQIKNCAILYFFE